MALRFFQVSARYPSAGEEDLNRFLASHAVAAIDRELVSAGEGSFWAICVEYHAGAVQSAPEPKKDRIDYREKLSVPDFDVFSKLRTLRKQLADREGVPAYALFTNEQLAALVTLRVASLAELQKLPGVGPARAEKYGAQFLELLKAALPPTPEPK